MHLVDVRRLEHQVSPPPTLVNLLGSSASVSKDFVAGRPAKHQTGLRVPRVEEKPVQLLRSSSRSTQVAPKGPPSCGVSRVQALGQRAGTGFAQRHYRPTQDRRRRDSRREQFEVEDKTTGTVGLEVVERPPVDRFRYFLRSARGSRVRARAHRALSREPPRDLPRAPTTPGSPRLRERLPPRDSPPPALFAIRPGVRANPGLEPRAGAALPIARKSRGSRVRPGPRGNGSRLRVADRGPVRSAPRVQSRARGCANSVTGDPRRWNVRGYPRLHRAGRAGVGSRQG